MSAGLASETLALSVVLIEPDGSGLDPAALGSIPAIFIARERHELADIAVEDHQLATLLGAVQATPLAAVALAVLLRGSEQRDIGQGLVAESTAYAMLQAGAEFAAWQRRYVPPARLTEIGPVVRAERYDDVLAVTLARPHVHNAFNHRMRDELTEVLAVAAADDSIDTVRLSGVGASFCSGGDLHEFGSFPSPPEAHVIRLTRSPARLMAAIGGRVEVDLHGACLGAGIELAAFAHRVRARPDTQIGLPELGLGLIPGAGGTVSLTRRIGRHRTAWLALTGERIDAATALAWGLVDEVLAQK